MAENANASVTKGQPLLRRPPIYPWADWADGRIHDLYPEKDFHSKLATMVGNIHRHANEHGLRAQVKMMPDGSLRMMMVPQLWWELGSVEAGTFFGKAS